MGNVRQRSDPNLNQKAKEIGSALVAKPEAESVTLLARIVSLPAKPASANGATVRINAKRVFFESVCRDFAEIHS
jgi:hypothetical protein